MRFVAALMALVVATATTGTAGSGQLELEVPAQLRAGEPMTVTVAAPGHDTATLMVVGGLRSHVATLELAGGNGSLTVADPTLLRAGAVTVVARSGGLEVMRHVEVLAGDATAPLYPAVSPARVDADGVTDVTVLALPEDSNGNPVADGTGVRVSWTGPAGTTESASTATADLVAHVVIEPGRLAGPTEIAVVVSDVAAPGAFDVVPGLPVPMALTAVRPAGGDDVIVESERLVDAAGNELLDGAAVAFVIDDARGRQLVQSQVIGGRARLRVPAPDEGGPITVTMIVAGVASLPVTLLEEGP